MPGAHQSYSVTSPPQLDGGEKYNEMLVGGEKDRERSLTSYLHSQKRLNLGKLI